MLTRIFSATPHGITAKIVAVEVAYNPGLPAMHIVGLPDTAIRESRERIRGCLRNCRRIEYPIGRIVVNLAPASLHKYGTQFDLGIAIGILSLKRKFRNDVYATVFIGELSLDGSIKPVLGCLAMVMAAKAQRFSAVVIPWDQADETAVVSGIETYPVRTIEECLSFCEGLRTAGVRNRLPRAIHPVLQNATARVDFKDIQGMDFAKRGLEIAAAGGHNLLLSGSPGTGKTILAQALQGIVPKLDERQLLETVAIHGLRSHDGMAGSVPFRAPVPGIPMAAFIGGGTVLQPGEVTLAHNGVLFMDEFPEFPRAIIEALRQPLESGTILLNRLRETFMFPARFMLVAAQNLCPCGNYGDLHRECLCSALQVAKYQKKVSGPILDHIDIHIRLQRSHAQEPTKAESSEEVAFRVAGARAVQLKRNPSGCLNAHIPWNELDTVAALMPSAAELLHAAEHTFGMSMRAKAKTVKVARTIADIAGLPAITKEHLAEALRYRFTD